MNKITELFSGENGRLSSKRVCGAITLVFALLLTVIVVIFDKNADVLKYPYTAASALLGIGVVEGLGSRLGFNKESKSYEYNSEKITRYYGSGKN